MTVDRAHSILNEAAGWEKYSRAEARAVRDGLRAILRAVRSSPKRDDSKTMQKQ